MNIDLPILEWFDKITFFMNSASFDYVARIVIIYCAALWLSLVIWVTRDAIHRSSNILFQIGVILINIFLPIFGLVLYLIIRPEKTLLEKYQEDLEYRLLEGGSDFCFSCGAPAKTEFAYCPNCGEELTQECGKCSKKYSRRWKICPYCGEGKETPKKKKKTKGKE